MCHLQPRAKQVVEQACNVVSRSLVPVRDVHLEVLVVEEVSEKARWGQGRWGSNHLEKKYQKVPIKIGMSIAIAIGFVFLILRPSPLAFAIPRRPLPE